ncbi:unnamed protein product [Linum tenue]|uniref:NAD-dependent epimerase/dehydratase domain-containing protein n=1 Tax=Linum tenue TaxID=586396 RepID=A0AAV0P6T8_9ROSI|nr:unnamed protein product [Linum tenue]
MHFSPSSSSSSPPPLNHLQNPSLLLSVSISPPPSLISISPQKKNMTPPPRRRSIPAVRYLLGEHRLPCFLAGFALAALFFHSFPLSTTTILQASDPGRVAVPDPITRRVLIEEMPGATGKVPQGLKRKGNRILVTGGAGFVGSHLVDRLIGRGDSVIVIDNFFTGRKENLMHHFGNHRFELIRHDVVEPILLEVDQIYHLACPASPVHYKFNPVKTIISFLY